MKHYGIDVSAERRSTLPVWDIEYESKFIYSETTDTLYYGSDTGWVTVSGGGGGTSSHSALTELDYASANHTGFAPTSHSHTESNISDLDKYTQAEVDGLITTISGKLDDHNELNNLDYASAGHTGFQPAGNYATDAELTSASGTLQTDIDTKATSGGAEHDNFSDFVANEHIDHSGVSVTAGTGLTGGGDITLTRTLDVDVGITDDKIVQIDDLDAASGDYAKLTANGIEGRSASEAFGDIKQDATESATGVSERATDAETLTGIDTTRHISPANLKYVLDRQDYYGVSWDESQATGGYTRTGRLLGFATSQSLADALLPIQASMRRCILNDSGVVQYYLDSTTSYNRNGQAPYISGQDDAGASYKVSDGITVSGTDDVGTASKISDVGVFSAAASEYVGKWVHNTTDDTYALITAKDSNDVLSINADIMDIGETFNIGVLSAPASEYEGHYVKNTTDTTYALITAKDSDIALSIDADIMANGENFEICTAALDGTDGQVMTEIPAFYYSYSYSGTTHTWEISLHPLSGFSIHPAFIKNDEFVPYRYYSAYEGVLYDTSASRYTNGLQLPAVSMTFANATSLITCASLSHPFTLLEAGDKFVIAGTTHNNGTLTVASKTDQTITTVEALTDETAGSTTLETEKNWATDVLSSVSGKAPINYGTRANFRTAGATRGTGWRQQDYDLVSAIQLLYLVEYADWNSQLMIGNGLTDWSSAWPAWSNYNPIEKTGLSNILGNATGNVSNGDGIIGSYMSYRGIENFFGHLWKWVDGININNNIPYVSNKDTDFADDTTSNYTDLGIVLAASDGYIKTLEQQGRGFLPASTGGASNTYITDDYYQNAGWRVAMLSGIASYGARAGVAFLRLHYSSGSRYRTLVGRLCR